MVAPTTTTTAVVVVVVAVVVAAVLLMIWIMVANDKINHGHSLMLRCAPCRSGKLLSPQGSPKFW